MPFDGIGFAVDDRLNKIDQVVDLLSTPDKWTKGVLKTRDGRHCLRGAINAVEGVALLNVVSRAIDEVTGRVHFRIESFNDHRDTDHALVLQVLQRARENLILAAVNNAAPTRDGYRVRLRDWINRLTWST